MLVLDIKLKCYGRIVSCLTTQPCRSGPSSVNLNSVAIPRTPVSSLWLSKFLRDQETLILTQLMVFSIFVSPRVLHRIFLSILFVTFLFPKICTYYWKTAFILRKLCCPSCSGLLTTDTFFSFSKAQKLLQWGYRDGATVKTVFHSCTGSKILVPRTYIRWLTITRL